MNAFSIRAKIALQKIISTSTVNRETQIITLLSVENGFAPPYFQRRNVKEQPDVSFYVKR